MTWDKIERRRGIENGKQIIDFITDIAQEQSKDIKELIRLAAQNDNKTSILLSKADLHETKDDVRFEKIDTRFKLLERSYFIFIGVLVAIEGFFKFDKWIKP